MHGRSNNSFARRALEGICVLCWLGNVSFADRVSQSVGAASPTNIFAPSSTPADSIFGLSLFVLAVTAAIFVLVASLLVYASCSSGTGRTTTAANLHRSTAAIRWNWRGR